MSRRTSADGDLLSQKRRTVPRSSSCSSLKTIATAISSVLSCSYNQHVQCLDLVAATPERVHLQRPQRRPHQRCRLSEAEQNVRDAVDVDLRLAATAPEQWGRAELAQHFVGVAKLDGQ